MRTGEGVPGKGSGGVDRVRTGEGVPGKGSGGKGWREQAEGGGRVGRG